MSETVRLQKILAAAGLGSRRYCEIMIESGRVSVNGQVVRELGSRATWEDEIRVDGVLIVSKPETLVYAFNKPRGVVSAMSDPKKRSLGEFAADLPVRVFHVGRLDEDTEGLLILTNDGELAQRLSHPSFEISKTYLATVDGNLTESTRRKLLAGIELDDGPIHFDRVNIRQHLAQQTLVELVLHSGRNRIVRRAMAATGHPVRRLVRTHIGELGLDGLKPGQFRMLDPRALKKLSKNSNW